MRRRDVMIGDLIPAPRLTAAEWLRAIVTLAAFALLCAATWTVLIVALLWIAGRL